VPDVNDLNYIMPDAIEHFETIFLDDLPVHAGDVGFLRPVRMSPDELDGSKNRP
jgi:hypothetical protein